MTTAAAASANPSNEGLEALLGGASRPIEDLPMLRVAVERTAAACAHELSGLCGVAPQVALQGIRSGAAADLLAPHRGSSIVGVLQAPKWETRLVVSLNRDLVHAVLEMMLGSDASEPAVAPEREFTRIERRLATILLERFANALAGGFAKVAETAFLLERTTDTPDLSVLGRRGTAVTVAKLRLDAPGRAGELLLAIPQSALRSLRKTLSRAASSDAIVTDPGWTQQIREEVTRANITLSAILDERKGTLSEIADLRIGQILELNATKDSRVRVECNGERLMWCHLGKANGVYTLRVDGPIDREQEFVEDLLAG